jgi:hypothetical protein
MQRDEIRGFAMALGVPSEIASHPGVVEIIKNMVELEKTKMTRQVKEACKPYGKAGECVYSTFKHSLEKAKK